MEEDDSLDIRPPGQERPPPAEWFCQPCGIQFKTGREYLNHCETKAHSKKVSPAEEMKEHDFYVDEDTLAYKTIMGVKTKFSGCEYIVLDKTDSETKCILCKAILRDPNAIIAHLKSQKHLFSYVDKHYPEVFRSIQRKAKSKQEISSLMQKHAEELIKKYGKKEPLVHEKGYYDSLPPEIRQSIDRHLEARRREHNDQRKCRVDQSPAPTKDIPSTSKSPDRSTSQSRARDNRQSSKDRDMRDRHNRERRRSRSRDRNRDKDSRRSRSRDRGVKERDRPKEKEKDKDAKSSASKQQDIDTMDELPTDFEIFDVLYSTPTTAFQSPNKAYIQELLNALATPIIGLDYILEYPDPKGQFEPGYVCTLCDCRMNPPQAVRHAVSDKHTMNYLKKHFERQYMALQIKTLSEEVRQQMKLKQMTEIAQKESRVITQYIKLPVDKRFAFKFHKKTEAVKAANQSSPPKSKPQSRAAEREDRENRRKNDSAAREKERDKEREKRKLEEKKNKLRKELPHRCEWSFEDGWYSVRKYSLEHYERLAEPDALYFSIRDPEFHKSDFYGDWNPQIMRRLQDKFNFKLEHIRWLQKLLMDWRVPLYVPLQQLDLKPLEEEVESAVLDELLNRTLKPVDFMKNQKVYTYDDKTKEKKDDRKKSDDAGNKRSAGITMTLAAPESKKPALEKSTVFSSKNQGSRSDDDPVEPKNEQEEAMLQTIDQLLRTSSGQSAQNDVLSLIVSFPNARQLLFRLATQRPVELQRLIDLAKRPVLKAPEAMITRLREMLERETVAFEQDRAQAQLAQMSHKELEEERRKQREMELKQRIDQARQEKLNSRRGAKEAEEKVNKITGTSAQSTSSGMQVLTPKLPSVTGPLTSTHPTPSVQGPIAASGIANNPISNSAVLNAIMANVQQPMQMNMMYQQQQYINQQYNPFGQPFPPGPYGQPPRF